MAWQGGARLKLFLPLSYRQAIVKLENNSKILIRCLLVSKPACLLEMLSSTLRHYIKDKD